MVGKASTKKMIVNPRVEKVDETSDVGGGETWQILAVNAEGLEQRMSPKDRDVFLVTFTERMNYEKPISGGDWVYMWDGASLHQCISGRRSEALSPAQSLCLVVSLLAHASAPCFTLEYGV